MIANDDILGRRPSANAEDNSSISFVDKAHKPKKEIDCIMMQKGFVKQGDCKYRNCEFYDYDCNEIVMKPGKLE